MAKLGEIRERELRQAGAILGLEEVIVLDFIDGDLDRADPLTAIHEISSHIRRIQPQVVITFPPDGIYGHPDHIAVSQLTLAAVVHASGADQPHRVDKLYYCVSDQEELSAYQPVFGELLMEIDGQRRTGVAWQDWAITTRIETSAYIDLVCRAVSCHHSQLVGVRPLEALRMDEALRLWGVYKFYRALSLVNGGSSIEDDLFAGVRGRN
jgi:LmbE family N-acetylglucosaminyl deacetylase